MSKYIENFRENVKLHIAQTLLRFENIVLSQIETQQLLEEGQLTKKIREDEGIIIENLLDALAFVDEQDLENLAIDHTLFIQLNSLLAKNQALSVGEYRDRFVHIHCITEPIEIPNINHIAAILTTLENLNEGNCRETVASSFCKLARMQPFFDGNKRSALFLCNIALFKKNLGFLSINEEDHPQFEQLLTDYYQGREEGLISFMKNNVKTQVYEADQSLSFQRIR